MLGRRALSALLLAAAAPLVLSARAPAPDTHAGETRAFLISGMTMEGADEPTACKPLSDGTLDTFYKGLSPEEKKQYPFDKLKALQDLMNRRLGFKRVPVSPPLPQVVPIVRDHGEAALPPELAARVAQLRAQAGAPPGKGMINDVGRGFAYDSCTNPEDFPQAAKGYKPYDGKLAVGINLDGKTDSSDFVGPNGEKGIDNQLWRAIGCIKIFREEASPEEIKQQFSSPMAPALFEVRKVNDWRNDPDVELVVYNSNDAIATDARGGPLRHASYDVDPAPRYQARAQGKIVNGVLTTEPFDMVLHYKGQIIDAVRDIRQARLRATFKPDGAIDGRLYGYYTTKSFWEMMRQFTQNGADQTQIACPGLRAAVDRFADGVRDPRTRKYTAISSAFYFYGVPAHAVQSAPARRNARIGAGNR